MNLEHFPMTFLEGLIVRRVPDLIREATELAAIGIALIIAVSVSGTENIAGRS